MKFLPLSRLSQQFISNCLNSKTLFTFLELLGKLFKLLLNIDINMYHLYLLSKFKNHGLVPGPFVSFFLLSQPQDQFCRAVSSNLITLYFLKVHSQVWDNFWQLETLFLLMFSVMLQKGLIRRRTLIYNLWRQSLVNKQLQYTYCPISREVKAIRQWNLVS